MTGDDGQDRVLAWLRDVVAGAPARLGPLSDAEATILRRDRLDALAVLRGAEHSSLDGAERASYRSGIVQQITAARALAALSQAGIRGTVLKGLPLAVRFWGDAAARVSSDVDLLVPDGSVADARLALEEGGFVYRDIHPGWYVRTWFYHVKFGDPRARSCLVELHWDFKRKGYRRTPVDAMLDSSREVDCGVRRLTALDTPWQLVVSCVCAVSHDLAVRDLLDVALMSRTFDRSDWTTAVERARRCGVEQLLHLVVTASARRFGFELDEAVRRLRPPSVVARRLDDLVAGLPALGRADAGTVERLKWTAALALGPRALKLLATSAVHRPIWMWMRRGLPAGTAGLDG